MCDRRCFLMSKIREQKPLLQTKILLEHYKYICYLSELSKEEFSALINNAEPTIYAAFKNRSVSLEDTINIVATYKKVIRRTYYKIQHLTRSDDFKKNIDKYASIYIAYRVLKMKHFNKKNLSNEVIAMKLGISYKNNICREYQNALKLFYRFLIPIAKKNGLNNIFADNNIGIIKLLKLDKEAKSKRTQFNVA